MRRASQTHSHSSPPAREAPASFAPGWKAPAQDGDLRTSTSEEVRIGKGQFVKGKISGSGPIFVDGRVEGDIDIPNERVTIGEHGIFVAHARKDGQFGITAREIVILGHVIGNVSASHRVEIFQGGSITGDVDTPRLRIEDGGFFKGGVNLREENRDLREGAA